MFFGLVDAGSRTKQLVENGDAPDSIIGAAADHQAVSVLETRDASLVAVERAHELAR